MVMSLSSLDFVLFDNLENKGALFSQIYIYPLCLSKSINMILSLLDQPCGLLLSLTFMAFNSLATLKSTHQSLFLYMHSGIVNVYQLLCDAHTVLEPHRVTAALFLFYSLSSFSTFCLYVLVTLTVLFLFLGASLVCVNNL